MEYLLVQFGYQSQACYSLFGFQGIIQTLVLYVLGFFDNDLIMI
jgi:hypothetical protein